MNDIIVFDTETTGLTLHPDAELHKQPFCIEFGAMILSAATGEILAEHNVLINPGVPLEPIIVKITGITDDQLKDAPTFAQALPEIRALFARCSTVFAHNLPFDRAILTGELSRSKVTDFVWPSCGICTVGLYKEHWGRNPKMTELYASVMGRPLQQSHRALDDVRALVEIIQSEELWRLV